jgi:hypothetical protein
VGLAARVGLPGGITRLVLGPLTAIDLAPIRLLAAVERVLIPLVLIPLSSGKGLLSGVGVLALIPLLIGVPLARRIRQRIPCWWREAGLLRLSTRLSRLARLARLSRLARLAGLARLVGLARLSRLEQHGRGLLTWVGRPRLRPWRPLIGRGGRPLLMR